MSGLSFTIDAVALGGVMTAIANAADTWPQEKRDRFRMEWDELVLNGCQYVDVDGLIAKPSHDLLSHARAYGVDV